MNGSVLVLTILAPLCLLFYGWVLLRRERQVLFRNRDSDRLRHGHFLLPTVLGGAVAGLMAIRVLPQEWASLLTGPIALAGASLGIRYNDVLAPDGRGGWGRVAALWLGFALLLPGAAAWSLRHGPMNSSYFPLVAGWVIVSALPFGWWETLNARQCVGFSLCFYGAWLAIMLVAAALPQTYAGGILALGYFSSSFLANLIRRRLVSAAERYVAPAIEEKETA